jgi:hypothetical protein
MTVAVSKLVSIPPLGGKAGKAGKVFESVAIVVKEGRTTVGVGIAGKALGGKTGIAGIAGKMLESVAAVVKEGRTIVGVRIAGKALGGKTGIAGKMFESVAAVVKEGRSTVGVGIGIAGKAAEFVAVGVDTTGTAVVVGTAIVEKVSTAVAIVIAEAAEFVAGVVTGKATVLEKFMMASVTDAIPGGVAIVTGIAVVVVTVALEVANVISDERVLTAASDVDEIIIDVTVVSEEGAGVISDEKSMVISVTESAMSATVGVRRARAMLAGSCGMVVEMRFVTNEFILLASTTASGFLIYKKQWNSRNKYTDGCTNLKIARIDHTGQSRGASTDFGFLRWRFVRWRHARSLLVQIVQIARRCT